MRGHAGRRLALAGALLGAGLLAAAPAVTGPARGHGPGSGPDPIQRSLVFERFDAEIAVRANGDVVVRETLRPRFTGSWNGILRVVSLRHETAKGRRERLDLELRSATDGRGRSLEHEVERPDRWHRRFRVWVPGAENATRTVVLEYVVHDAIRFFDEDGEAGPLDELYWQVTGTEWEVPIEAASAIVVLPDGATAKQAAAYIGGPSSTARTPVELDGGVVRVPDAGPFRPGEGLTVAVGWPPGFVDRPSAMESAGRRIFALWPLLLVAFAYYVSYRNWDRRGRDPEPHSIMVRYDPPADLGPAELGTLVDHTVEMRDVTSMLVDLAVRGYIRIEELEGEGLLGKLKGKDYAFHLLKEPAEWDDLEAYEAVFLRGFFDADHVEEGFLESVFRGRDDDPEDPGWTDRTLAPRIELSDLENEFYKKLDDIHDAIYDRLLQRRFYERRPDSVRGRWMAMAAFLAFGGAAFFVAAANGVASPVLGAALVASGIVVGIFGWLMPARTEEGARMREKALGFKEFLDKVEADRFQRMITSPDLFEAFLPYALAFHVEDRWANAFEDLYTEPPDWYTTSRGYHAGAFDIHAFTSDLSGLTAAAGSTMSSSPGGSGGGGSVGGGSGGGGGGGF